MFNSITGLWKGKGKVALSALMKEEKTITIPRGAKIVILKNERKSSERSPDYSLGWFPADETDTPVMDGGEEIPF